MIKKGLKWISNILTVILLILLVILIYTKCVSTFSKSAYPDYFGYTFLEVASGSMEPTLKVHDVVIVKIDNSKIEKGDIVAYQTGDDIITHRVLFIDQDKVTLKGDANNTIDEPISKQNIIGKVVLTCKELGIWKSIFLEPKVIIALFVTLILFDLTLSYKGKEEKNKEREIKPQEEKTEEIKMEPIQEMSQEEKESMLEFTRKIDLKEIDSMLEARETEVESKTEEKKIPPKEKLELPKKIQLSDLPKLKKEEKSDYTMRLDLSEIQKRISKK